MEEEEKKIRWMAMLHVLQRITLTYLIIIIVPHLSWSIMCITLVRRVSKFFWGLLQGKIFIFILNVERKKERKINVDNH
jgi:hypothetical protein